MMFKAIIKWFSSINVSEKERIEAYLADSVSLADLERRQRELQSRGYNA